MKKIRLKIKGTYIYEDTEEDQMELVTEGKLYSYGDLIYLTYDESEMSGLKGCKTRLTLDGQTVSMTRRGSSVGIDTEIHFEKGKRYSGYYDTPYGPVEMEVLTNDLHNNVTAEGTGNVEIDYDVSLKGVSESRSRLNIEILQ
ncbi:MAG: DUF1934 domain-containing protein [Anaerovoracaceae bacterium]|jgi:uncharacterized beta-barrel protein YwiB (DUF1934 family)